MAQGTFVPKVQRALPRARAIGLGVVLGAQSVPRMAGAVDAHSHARFEGQAYDVVGPWPGAVFYRRRATYLLGLDVANVLDGRRPEDPDVRFHARMRLDTDAGIHTEEQDPHSPFFVPGLREGGLDVMYAYVEGVGYLERHLSFRLGRQILVDSLGFWSYDGALVQVAAGGHLRLGAYGGWEQRGGILAISTWRYERDGVMRGHRDGWEDRLYPEYLDAVPAAPAFGLSLETFDLGPLAVRLDYRRVWQRGSVATDPFSAADDGVQRARFEGTRISSERAGAQLSLAGRNWGSLSARLVYDLYLAVPSEYLASFDLYPSETSSIGISYDYYLPTFDADSIFNWFSHQGMSRALLRGQLSPSRQLDLGAWGGANLYRSLENPSGQAHISAIDGVLGLEGRYAWSESQLTLRSSSELGTLGRRIGGDLGLRRLFAGGFSDGLLLLSLYDFENALRPDWGGKSFTYVLGGGISPRAIDMLRTRLGAEWEHSVSEAWGHRFRVLLTAGVSWLL